MARRKDNRQVNVPVPRHSAMEAFYEEEAAAHGMKLPMWFRQLLQDRFEVAQGGQGRGIWQPAGTAALHSDECQELPPGAISTRFEDALAALGGEDPDPEDTIEQGYTTK